MDHFRIRPVGETDLARLICAGGGRRAHDDADRRRDAGADFLIGEALIELKELNDDGLQKPERQKKLAALFREYEPDRPVIVLHRARLPEEAQRKYDRILEGPLKNAVAKARTQLKQSRTEILEASCSILLVINNGYTALDHDELTRMIVHRVKNDTDEIDGVVVGGCYHYSDTFDSYFLWPFTYVPLRIDRPFSSFERLKSAWDAYAKERMNALLLDPPEKDATKGSLVDTQFEIDGVTYVKPTPPMGSESEFFGSRRPRNNTSGITECPPVAITFPAMTLHHWSLFRQELPTEPDLGERYEDWQRYQSTASETATALRPFVPVAVSHEGWKQWCAQQYTRRSMTSIRLYANALFESQIRPVLETARERTPSSILPHRYVLLVTEEIGQDRANDVSHIAFVSARLHGEAVISPVVEDARIFHEHALAVAAAYAVSAGLGSVLWQKDLTYGWT